MSRAERIVPKEKAATYLRRYQGAGLGDFELGKRNEDRAFMLMRELVDEGKLKTVRRATGKQNRIKGVDFWVYLLDYNEGVRVPVQVKSSAKSAMAFRELRDGLPEIAVVVINEYKSDASVKKEILGNMRLWISRNM